MRTLVAVILALLSLLAVFAGTAAVGFLRLRQLHTGVAQAALPPPPAETAASAGSTTYSPDWAIPAAGRIPSETPAPLAGAGAGDAPAEPDWAALPPLPKAALVLPAIEATVRGREIRVELAGGTARVAGWRDPEASVSWEVGPRRQGRYAVEVSIACGDDAGGAFVMSAGDQKVEGRARPTGGPDAYQTVAVGTIHLPPEGAKLTLHGRERTGGELMNVREVRLVPVP
jgi:hypothetical protein